jgi:hypothetical protein
MNFPKKVMLGSVLLLSATSVFAETADLRVIGTIAPSACIPVFAGGATVDYGVIPGDSLGNSTATNLAVRQVGYTITCNAPIAISTTWSDGRAGTANPVGGTRFGLGTHSGAPIGSYRLFQSMTVTGDGNPVALISRGPGSTGAWLAANPGANGAAIGTDGNQYSFAPTGTMVPGAYQVYGGSINVIGTIAPTNTLDRTTEITLDGLSTMTVSYL